MILQMRGPQQPFNGHGHAINRAIVEKTFRGLLRQPQQDNTMSKMMDQPWSQCKALAHTDCIYCAGTALRALERKNQSRARVECGCVLKGTFRAVMGKV